MMSKANVLLLLVVLVGLLLRVIDLGTIPNILNRDEAALAYNAYLLGQVGQDEWGVSWPLFLQSFGDYKLLGYPLILVGAFSVFGLSDFVVRLPAALVGTGLIGLAIATLNIFVSKDEESRMRLGMQFFLALSVCLSPVFIFYSRMAFEATVALSLFVAALLLILRQRPTRISDALAVLLIGMACLTYNTPLLLLPTLIVWLPPWRGLKQVRKWLPLFLSLLLILGVIGWLLLPVTAQKGGITIFSDENIRFSYAQYRLEQDGGLALIARSSFVYYAGLVLKAIVASLSPKFLAVSGGSHPWHSLPGWGHIYFTTYLLGWLGIVSAFYAVVRNAKKIALQIWSRQGLSQLTISPELASLYFLFAALAPAVVTVDAPHTTRSLLFLFLFIVMSARGIWLLLKLIMKSAIRFAGKKIIITNASLVMISLGLLVSPSMSYISDYWRLYPLQQARIYNSGFDATVHQLEEEHSDDSVAVVDPEGYQYILLAWYARVSPEEFYSTVVKQQPDSIGFRYGERVGRYRFVAEPEDRSDREKVLVYFENGEWFVNE